MHKKKMEKFPLAEVVFIFESKSNKIYEINESEKKKRKKKRKEITEITEAVGVNSFVMKEKMEKEKERMVEEKKRRKIT